MRNINLRGIENVIFIFSKNLWDIEKTISKISKNLSTSKGTPESSEFLKYTPIGEYSDNLGRKARGRLSSSPARSFCLLLSLRALARSFVLLVGAFVLRREQPRDEKDVIRAVVAVDKRELTPLV